MKKYSKEFKLEVVQAYLAGRLGQRKVAASFHIDRIQLRNWLSAYKAYGIAGLESRGRSRRYSTEFKLSVLAHRSQHHLSLQDVAILFKIPSFSTVYAWEQRYNQQGINAFADRRGRPSTMKKSDVSHSNTKAEKPLKSPTHAELLREIEYLKAENAYLKKLEALVQKKQLQRMTKPKSSLD